MNQSQMRVFQKKSKRDKAKLGTLSMFPGNMLAVELRHFWKIKI